MWNAVTRARALCSKAESTPFYKGRATMIYAGIDGAKDKHDCFIASSEGEMLLDVFTITNKMAVLLSIGTFLFGT